MTHTPYWPCHKTRTHSLTNDADQLKRLNRILFFRFMWCCNRVEEKGMGRLCTDMHVGKSGELVHVFTNDPWHKLSSTQSTHSAKKKRKKKKSDIVFLTWTDARNSKMSDTFASALPHLVISLLLMNLNELRQAHTSAQFCTGKNTLTERQKQSLSVAASCFLSCSITVVF